MASSPDHLTPTYRAGGGGMGGEPTPAHQLDFHQAMLDFKHMFPGMDEDIIEAVLRSNNGAVDATIDQLLTMNIDNDHTDDGFQPPPFPASVRITARKA